MKQKYFSCILLLCILLNLFFPTCLSSRTSQHNNNWAVIVCSSRFWFNYRHVANALSFYHTVKRLGIPDSNIILMLADDWACNARNCFPGKIFNNKDHNLNLYGTNVEIDYRGYEVNVENFLRLLTGRHEPDVPRNKRLLTDSGSNILVYLTGHGGNEFLKFQDSEEVSSKDIADAFEQMYQKKRYNEILFIIETCQANTLFNKFYSPNIAAIGCSELGENSYSHHFDSSIGVQVIDSFTYYSLNFLNNIKPGDSHTTLEKYFNSMTPKQIRSQPRLEFFQFQRNPRDVLVSDFFGSIHDVVSHPIYDYSFQNDNHNHNGNIDANGEKENANRNDNFQLKNQFQHRDKAQPNLKISNQFQHNLIDEAIELSDNYFRLGMIILIFLIFFFALIEKIITQK
ncbi:gpi-anchor transamidase [Anaeramoeba flamelloides]|uniref:Gpi-anchor transamidase n=1 Tax=Anaeramoeba flamelloides TaxID=1746091 RepID=A0AAV7YGR9_9EUKA|nr:gpi-anchor transamidase [Anaeramoeba flamelloides]